MGRDDTWSMIVCRASFVGSHARNSAVSRVSLNMLSLVKSEASVRDLGIGTVPCMLVVAANLGGVGRA